MGMGGLDVIGMRGVCASYAERHILPMMQELQSQQGQLIDQLKSLEDRISKQDASWASILGADLQARFSLKADVDKVPSLAQFEELVAKFEQLGKSNGEGSDLEARMLPVLGRLDELSATLEGKADAKDVVLAERLEELEALVSQKANYGDVATSEQLKKLSATVERKAFANKVPTISQLQELQSAVAAKVDANLVPTLAQVEELAAEVKRKNISTLAQEEMRKVAAELQHKANVADVLTAAQVERLVQQKLETLVSRKADVGEVPTLSQHKEFAAATERKFAFLATKVQQKNDAIREMYQQQSQTVWCVQPAMVDVAWDENGQAWPDWNPSRVMPGSGEDRGNLFVPPHMYGNNGQCLPQGSGQSGAAAIRQSSKGPEPSTRSGSSTGSSTAPTPVTPPQEVEKEA
mmetsp:Transcript_61080/g.175256  ORF Transcript_61080/g.175256 Transcript_61080/m.175256 type:complete len:407 (+) Transcript_61080:133-1353(+)